MSHKKTGEFKTMKLTTPVSVKFAESEKKELLEFAKEEHRNAGNMVRVLVLEAIKARRGSAS